MPLTENQTVSLIFSIVSNRLLANFCKRCIFPCHYHQTRTVELLFSRPDCAFHCQTLSTSYDRGTRTLQTP